MALHSFVFESTRNALVCYRDTQPASINLFLWRLFFLYATHYGLDLILLHCISFLFSFLLYDQLCIVKDQKVCQRSFPDTLALHQSVRQSVLAGKRTSNWP